jgi:hypothetical protein
MLSTTILQRHLNIEVMIMLLSGLPSFRNAVSVSPDKRYLDRNVQSRLTVKPFVAR